MTESVDLPVNAILPQLAAALRDGTAAVLEAPPGAGKSTVVPLALLDEPWVRGRRILLLEPRRLAARAVAARMAQTLREPVGETVGYRMRLDTRVTSRTRLEVVTEGVLTRMLQQDAALEGVAAVIFDEFHERSLNADLGLALCLEAQSMLRPDLRLLVMSATLDGDAVAELLGDAPVIRTQGRSYPVTIHYLGRGLPPLPDANVPLVRGVEAMLSPLRQVLAETEGDVLMFLPGAPEIHRLRVLLEDSSGDRTLLIHLLAGELALEAQQAALAPAPQGKRKLILATNIAETSLTIEGVTVVVDSGLARRSLFDPGTGMSRLATVRVSQSSATQRAGRAGRTAPGQAYRLWGESAATTLMPQSPPEILTADLAPLALELAQWGTRDANSLRWMDAPPTASMAQARELLRRLEAVDDRGAITAMGRDMAQTGLHPRLAHMLVRARRESGQALAAQLAAMLSERDFLRGQRDPDIRTRLELLQRGGAGIDRSALARVRDMARRLGTQTEGQVISDQQRIGELLAWAYPDRIAQMRVTAEGNVTRRYLLSNGRGAVLKDLSTLANAPYLVAIDLDDSEGAEAQIRLAAPITLDQIELALAAQIEESVETSLAHTQSLRSRKVVKLGALVLRERKVEVQAAAASQALLESVRKGGLSVLAWGGASRALSVRLGFAEKSGIARVQQWPAFDDATLLASLEEWLGPFLNGLSRLSQLSDARLHEALSSRLDFKQKRRLDELVPTHLSVPTGSRIAIDYEDDNAPCVEVRLQEVFGLADTPRIAEGRIAIALKLLSPARRPVQITRELGGFWKGSYAEVRKEMRGRYPRHYWPENPLEAEPTRGLKPRRS
jgi:ATP-dependent helicase HrpB